MTDSTIDNKPGEGGFDVGSSAEELFGGIDEESSEAAVDRDGGAVDGGTNSDVDADDIEDQTAASVFGQLKNDVDADGADEVLADESPDDIIASADEPDPDPEPVHEDLRPVDDELTDLLLTGRTKDQEFLWIDTEAEDETTTAAEEGTPADGSHADGTDVAAGDRAAGESPEQTPAEDANAAETAVPAGSEPETSGAETAEEGTRPSGPATPADDPSTSRAQPADSELVTGDEKSDGIEDDGPIESDPAATPDDTADAESQALAVHESETSDVPAATDDDADDADSPGFVRRLLAKLNPF